MAELAATREAGGLAEERIAVATQWQLMWWRFRKHKLAAGGTIVLIAFYVVALFADFFAYADPQESDAQRSLMAPQSIHWIDDGRFRPYVYALKGTRDPNTFKRVYVPDTNTKIPITFFGHGEPYAMLGFIPTDRHLLAAEGAKAGESLFLLGTDMQGRDLWSRLMYATRTSMTIGLVSVALSLVLGVALGGISGYFGGVIDTVIQRIIEILRSIPTIPLWMGLAAALPGRLGRRAGLLRHHDHHLAHRLDRARAGRSRAVHLAQGRGFRHGGRARRLQQVADHLPPHGAVVHQPHHRGDNARDPRDDHQRDLALASSVWGCGRPRSAGAFCFRMRRTSRRWSSRRGFSSRPFP